MNNFLEKEVHLIENIPGRFVNLSVKVVVVLVFAIRGALASPVDVPALPLPDPELQPGVIVQIVVDALAKNDQPYPNAGIETAFNFASPANKSFTGPIERFVTLVKGPVFGQMVNHRNSTVSEAVFEGDQAICLVQIINTEMETFYFAFRLGFQQQGDYAGMWLTEAVWPLENPEDDMLAL